MDRKASHQILKKLDDHEKRIRVLENREKKKVDKKVLQSSISARPRTTLPEHIIALRENRFFKQPKIALEVHAKLQPTYPCDMNRVEVALVRLRKAGKLRKSSKVIKKKRLVAYVW